MENRTFVNYKLYDEKKRRVAVFGEEIKNIIRIRAYTCSRHDQFSKQKARQAYYIGAIDAKPVHPMVIDLPIYQGKTAKFTFIEFCRANFYRKEKKEMKIVKEVLVLYRDDNTKDIISPSKINN